MRWHMEGGVGGAGYDRLKTSVLPFTSLQFLLPPPHPAHPAFPPSHPSRPGRRFKAPPVPARPEWKLAGLAAKKSGSKVRKELTALKEHGAFLVKGAAA